MEQETRPFYIGISKCGCITATLVDDENTTAKEIAEFARSMQKTKRRMSHRNFTKDEFLTQFKLCEHKDLPNGRGKPTAECGSA